jgi:type I restriction enzyme R subunit
MKFEELNRVRLSENEFLRLREEIINPDVFAASKMLRERQYFQREDGTPLYYTLVNIKDWCKNDYEVINQLKINTENSYHRFDIILLINGLPEGVNGIGISTLPSIHFLTKCREVYFIEFN